MDIVEKTCKICKIQKPLDSFRKKKGGKYGKYNKCRQCCCIEYEHQQNVLSNERKQQILDNKKRRYHFLTKEEKRKNLDKQKEYYMKYPEKILYKNARHRAKEENLEFDIQIDDIVIPEFCPILGIRLIRGSNKICNNSPTLDRVDINKGYIKGNISVISNKANRLKNNGTSDEHRKIADYIDSFKL